MKLQAMQLAEQGRLEEAKRLFEAICDDSCRDAEAWLWLGRVNARLADVETAENCCRRALELQADHAGAHFLLGRVLMLQGRHAEAAEQFHAARRLAPDDPNVFSHLGYALLQQGQYKAAEECYEAVVRLTPQSAEAYYNLGNIKREQKKYSEAAACFQQAIHMDPNNAAAHNNLGMALFKQGQVEAAMAGYNRALELDPGYAEAFNNLGNALRLQGSLEEAQRTFNKALRLKPGLIEAYIGLANVHRLEHRHGEAIETLRAAIARDPRNPELHTRLADLQFQQDRYDEAAAGYETVIRLRPQSALSHYSLGSVRRVQKRYGEAAASFQTAVRLDPGNAAAHNDLAGALFKQGRIEAAIDHYMRALDLDPGYAHAYNNLAVALMEQGSREKAEQMFKSALQLNPTLTEVCATLGAMYNRWGETQSAVEMLQRFSQSDGAHADAHGALLMTMQYVPEYTPDFLTQAARQWAAPLAHLARRPAAHANSPDVRRRLRVGYVSADFHHHPVGYFLDPVLQHRDSGEYEIYCYSNGAVQDDQTRRLQRLTDHWRNIAGQTDEAVAAQIEGDGIDVLIDLSGHTAENRLLVFARRPAPVQATWMGYFATTGLDAMDYVIADRFVIPTAHEAQFVERVVRLPHSFLCYSPPSHTIDVSPLPALSSGRITFGCFNNPAKVSKNVIAIWAAVMRAVPGSRLHLKYKRFDNDEACDYYRSLFAEHGIAPERIVFAGHSRRESYFSSYAEVDIALDPHPYNGGTITADALWMGVPVITLAGDRFVSRMGTSLLTTVGLEELVAATEDDYIAKAVTLARDSAALAALRGRLREQVRRSPLCNGAEFAEAFEDALRGMWAAWCSRNR